MFPPPPISESCFPRSDKHQKNVFFFLQSFYTMFFPQQFLNNFFLDIYPKKASRIHNTVYVHTCYIQHRYLFIQKQEYLGRGVYFPNFSYFRQPPLKNHIFPQLYFLIFYPNPPNPSGGKKNGKYLSLRGEDDFFLFPPFSFPFPYFFSIFTIFFPKAIKIIFPIVKMENIHP